MIISASKSLPVLFLLPTTLFPASEHSGLPLTAHESSYRSPAQRDALWSFSALSLSISVSRFMVSITPFTAIIHTFPFVDHKSPAYKLSSWELSKMWTLSLHVQSRSVSSIWGGLINFWGPGLKGRIEHKGYRSHSECKLVWPCHL